MDDARSGPSSAVTRFVSVELIDVAGTSALGTAELHYDPTDPYAVRATILTGVSEVTWTFGRDLLIEGTYRPSGDGDVHVSPSVNQDGRAVVLVELHAGGAMGLVQAGARAVQSFVDAMIEAVRPGTECEHLDVDASLEALLVAGRGE
jgi:hypothetical protein